MLWQPACTYNSVSSSKVRSCVCVHVITQLLLANSAGRLCYFDHHDRLLQKHHNTIIIAIILTIFFKISCIPSLAGNPK